MEEQRGLIAWFARNHVAANLLMMFIITTGIYGAMTIRTQFMPTVELDAVNVRVPYRGAAPA